MDDALLQIYNQELMQRATEVSAPHFLEHADLKACAVSPICGSKVVIELALENNKIVGFGYEVEACSLTKLVISVMKQAILGKTREEVSKAGDSLRSMLNGTGAFPKGDWADLKMLAPVIEYKSRHNSILLPFEAVEKAFK